MKKKMMVIGKFNLTHKGHVDMFYQVDEEKNIEKILLCLTSGGKNIFGWNERKYMLEEALKGIKTPIEYYNIPDINDPQKYAEHVMNIIGETSLDDIVLFTGNPYTANCFKGKCDIKVPKIRELYNSSRLIDMIGIGDGSWQDQVPESTRKYVLEHGGADRVNNYFNSVGKKYRNPTPTSDIIIEYKGGIVLIERRNEPYGLALPGGYHEMGLTCEENAKKEAKEETNLEIDIQRLVGVYSKPDRDPRQHNLSITFLAKGYGKLSAGDDAKDARVFKEHEIPWEKLCFDHADIIKDYLMQKKEYTNGGGER